MQKGKSISALFLQSMSYKLNVQRLNKYETIIDQHSLSRLSHYHHNMILIHLNFLLKVRLLFNFCLKHREGFTM